VTDNGSTVGGAKRSRVELNSFHLSSLVLCMLKYLKRSRLGKLIPRSVVNYPTISNRYFSNTSSPPQNVQHAVVSTFDLFSIGVGPSSSHTVGPMRAAKIFIEDLIYLGILEKAKQLRVDLYGSLALTGVGHGTPNAILVGLEGDTPETVDTKSILPRINVMYQTKKLLLNGKHEIHFCPEKHLVFHFAKTLPGHPNGMRFSCFDKDGDLLATNEFFSIGGGFVVNEKTQLAAQNVFYKDQRVDHAVEVQHTKSSDKEAEILLQQTNSEKSETTSLPTRVESKYISVALPFDNAQSLLEICEKQNMTIAQVVFQNELQWRNADEITARTLHIWDVMNTSIQNGITSTQEYLPGGLRVKRRAPPLHQKLLKGLHEYAGVGQLPIQQVQKKAIDNAISTDSPIRPHRSLPALDWISLYAIAVNEENAAGGRVGITYFI
jgi:L-serine deaminase